MHFTSYIVFVLPDMEAKSVVQEMTNSGSIVMFPILFIAYQAINAINVDAVNHCWSGKLHTNEITQCY